MLNVESFELEFNPSESELLPTISKSVLELFLIIPNSPEKRFESRSMKIG